ncbi:MAG: hypothetical protein NC517_06565 [Firmicutes bacterium]|nr:hypothetical protein [Bacillota bacterium]
MKELIEKKLEEYGKKILAKSEMSMDDVNFLVFWMNRLEMKEKAEAAKANEEILREKQEANNKAWREHMFGMLEKMPN